LLHGAFGRHIEMAIKMGMGRMERQALRHWIFKHKYGGKRRVPACVPENCAHKVILTLLTLDSYPMEITATARVGA
jgi:hypothetical protein